MTKLRRFTLSLLLLTTVAVAQSAVQHQVTQLTLEILNQTEKQATYRLTNISHKPLTCYSVAVEITHNDGERSGGQESECDYTKGILAPHASLERTTNIEGNLVNYSGTAKVDIEPSLAVFQDGSHQARDDRSWHILMDGMKLGL